MTEPMNATFDDLKTRTQSVLSSIETLLSIPDEGDPGESETIDAQLQSIRFLLEGSKETPGLVARMDEAQAMSQLHATRFEELAISFDELQKFVQRIQMDIKTLHAAFNGLNARIETLSAEMKNSLLHRPAKHNLDIT